MLYNTAFEPATGWNFIISAPWTDKMSIGAVTRIVAGELNSQLGVENREAISRITVLRTANRIVREMNALYPVSGRGAPISQISAGTITEGTAFVYYSQKL